MQRLSERRLLLLLLVLDLLLLLLGLELIDPGAVTGG